LLPTYLSNLKPKEMKACVKMLICMIITVMHFSCEKEPEFINRSVNTEALKRANVSLPFQAESKGAVVSLPFKADCWAVPDWNSAPILIEGLDPNSYSLSRLIVGGNGTRLGKINPEGSYYVFDSMKFVMDNGMPFVELEGVGKITGANGDSMEFDFKSLQSALPGDRPFTGEINIIPGSGTGKFEGAIGSLKSHGATTPDGIWFKVDGYLTFE
jgi:hypothetical protein